MKRRKAPRHKAPQERGTRLCCACRLRAPRASMMRFVIDQEHHAWLDPHLKAPGRGAHLCYAERCVALTWKKKSLNASFKVSVSLPPLAEFHKTFVESQLHKVANLIGLARRRGEVISGLNMLKRSPQRLSSLLYSSDISAQSREDLQDIARGEHLTLQSSAPFLPESFIEGQLAKKDHNLWIDSLNEKWSGASLGSLIGKAHRVAVGVTSREITEQLSLEIMRISQVLVATSP